MSSSELSDALNPLAVQRTSPTVVAEYSATVTSTTSTTTTSTHQLVYSSSAGYVPHRSELELAMVEPQSSTGRSDATQRNSPQANGTRLLQELLRVATATKETQEAEFRRRRAWEQEQEDKINYLLSREHDRDTRVAEITELRNELALLRAHVSASAHTCPPALPPDTPSSSASGTELAINSPPQLMSPISPSSQAGPLTQHLMRLPDLAYNAHHHRGEPCSAGSRGAHLHNYTEKQLHCNDLASPLSPTASQSPLLPLKGSSHSAPASLPSPIASPHRSKKKRRSVTPSSENDNDSDSSFASFFSSGRPRKRLNHHDKRCLTIQHAMRAHFWRVLGISNDGKLPASHAEGTPLGPSDPVRFVWEKTTKQSVHNSRMKARVIADLKQNRQQYKHVPSKDFGKKILDAAFEQCFTTFRQKYRVQTDETVAAQSKRREEAKARKARHASRRKIKLANRAEARLKIPALQHVAFDCALRIECMSSEESDADGESDVLVTRGYSWRSSRLLRFYHALDQEEISDRSNKPRRGAGKRDRLVGPSKEDSLLPPKGVAYWMISKRWLRSSRRNYPDLPGVLDDLVTDEVADFNWNEFHLLGEETDLSDNDCGDHKSGLVGDYSSTHTTSSLQYALGRPVL
ncbi:hypothetical protein CC1G_00195 [Coprinopsis cinerea okayama7|uniref:Uncharacterized protein n=1 Tax=Coprinopsis cinerea (strain Okayama-7 / 130 / ATCC MYA-4618 / FGSC 9003) TaxID=240176 RepID=A8NX39_COPC7|nr:hypothetical protein CC1G_00195 [Coprinopsis cinerea okayama7\|eukprot:XP_001837059.2 hypothetical protein CC1G_00195 [Coprinopsis cinerea okayama7\